MNLFFKFIWYIYKIVQIRENDGKENVRFCSHASVFGVNGSTL